MNGPKANILVSLRIDPCTEIAFRKDFAIDKIYELLQPIHTGEIPALNTPPAAVKTVYRLREKFCEGLAGEIAELILKSLKTRDTHNGYPVVNQGDD